MQVIDGKNYYTLEESAALAGVSVRTLRRWLSAGQLSDFLYPFRAGPGEILYRLEEPDEDDTKNEKGEWTLPQYGLIPSGKKGGVAGESSGGS